jgi:hypothetical protein
MSDETKPALVTYLVTPREKTRAAREIVVRLEANMAKQAEQVKLLKEALNRAELEASPEVRIVGRRRHGKYIVERLSCGHELRILAEPGRSNPIGPGPTRKCVSCLT